MVRGKSESLGDMRTVLPEHVIAVLEKLDFNSDGNLTEDEMVRNAGLLDHLIRAIAVNPGQPPSISDIERGIEMLKDINKQKALNSTSISYTHMPETIQEVMRMWQSDESGRI